MRCKLHRPIGPILKEQIAVGQRVTQLDHVRDTFAALREKPPVRPRQQGVKQSDA
jgi:hypothetical protein